MPQDRPLLRTSVALVVTVVLVILFLQGLFFTVSVASPICSGGSDGTVTQSSCGPIEWRLGAIAGLVTLGFGFGLLGTISELRNLSRRWNSPLFTPTMWASGSGIFLALLIFWIVRSQPYAAHGSTCIGNECSDFTDVQLLSVVIVAVLATAAAIPLAVSALNLWRTWRHTTSV